MTRCVTSRRSAPRAVAAALICAALGGCDTAPDVSAQTVVVGMEPAQAAPDYGSSCGDLRAAPPPLALPGGDLAAPIDLRSVSAELVFDPADGRARGSGRLLFTTGAGDPAFAVFALGQVVTDARLDGRALPPSALSLVALPGPHLGEVWVVREALPPCSTHELVLAWAITPALPGSPASLELGDGLAAWRIDLTDLEAGGYVDRWLPANLAFDAFALTLRVRLEGVAEAHALVSNAASEERPAEGRWTLRWPATSDAMSPLVALGPASWVRVRELPDDGARLAIVDPEADEAGLDALAEGTRAALAAASARFGPRPGGAAPYLVVQGAGLADGRGDGMEYDHATLVDAPLAYILDHEVLHAWFGRDGFRPASDRDGWVDEAVATWAQGVLPRPPFPDGVPTREVSLGGPWRRGTPSWAYREGVGLLATVAHWSSDERVDAVLRGLAATPGRRLGTTDFICALATAMDERDGRERVVALFQALVPDADLDEDALATCLDAGAVVPPR